MKKLHVFMEPAGETGVFLPISNWISFSNSVDNGKAAGGGSPGGTPVVAT